jgi:ABC-type bacteriocin/lantibiotic exporter with double-glycine peptidase domain
MSKVSDIRWLMIKDFVSGNLTFETALTLAATFTTATILTATNMNFVLLYILTLVVIGGVYVAIHSTKETHKRETASAKANVNNLSYAVSNMKEAYSKKMTALTKSNEALMLENAKMREDITAMKKIKDDLSIPLIDKSEDQNEMDNILN